MSEFEKQQDKQDAAEIKNYTRAANMLIFGYRNISPQEKWLYVCLKHLCGKEGTRHLSLRYISEQTGISTGALSSSKNAKGIVNQGMMKHLHDSGLIHCEIKKHEGKGNPQYHVTITDIWALNQDFFLNRPKYEQVTEKQVNPSERLTSASEIRTGIPQTRSDFGQTCPNFGTNIRLDNKTTITDKITEQRDTVVSATQNDASLTFSPFSQNENDSHSEQKETTSLPANSTTIPEASPLPTQQAENASVLHETHNSTPTLENGLEVAKQEASDEICVAPTKRKSKKMLDLVPTPPPAKPLEDTPWSVEKCLAWGDYARKCVFAPSNHPQSKYYKSVEAAKKIIGQGIQENTFLSVYLNWMKGVNLNLEALPEGAICSETWPNYSVDLWVFIEHYEDEARKYKKAKLAQVFQPSTAAPIDLTTQRENARIKNLANLEKMKRIKAKLEEEKQQQAGKKRAAI